MASAAEWVSRLFIMEACLGSMLCRTSCHADNGDVGDHWLITEHTPNVAAQLADRWATAVAAQARRIQRPDRTLERVPDAWLQVMALRQLLRAARMAERAEQADGSRRGIATAVNAFLEAIVLQSTTDDREGALRLARDALEHSDDYYRGTGDEQRPRIRRRDRRPDEGLARQYRMELQGPADGALCLRVGLRPTEPIVVIDLVEQAPLAARTLARALGFGDGGWAAIGASAAEEKHSQPEGRYDIRRGTAGYAPIVATFGALSVAAIVFLLTFPPHHLTRDAARIALAAGLLMVAVISSFASSIGFAAIGAELDQTANLVPATMFLAVPASISFLGLLAAFEILAATYLGGSYATLFIVMVGAGGLLASLFTGLSVGDAWHSGATEENIRKAWFRKPHWEAIESRELGTKWANRVTAAGACPALLAMVLRPLGAGFTLTVSSANALVGLALGISLVAIVMGMLRTTHVPEDQQKGLRWQEAFGTTLVISSYALPLTLFLPTGK